MKTKLFAGVIIGVVFLFTACSSQPEIGDNEPEEPSVIIVKFKDPAYAEHVIVTDYENVNSLVLMRGNMCDVFFHKEFPESPSDGNIESDVKDRLRKPFWSLPDGWVLIDWAWFGTTGQAYPYNGNCVLTDVTWDNFYDYNTYHFEREIPHITKLPQELYIKKGIRIADLMAYSYPDGNYPTFQIHYVNEKNDYDSILTYSNEYFYFNALKRKRTDTSECLCCNETAEDLENLWRLLQSQISKLIENGDLYNLSYFDVRQLYSEP